MAEEFRFWAFISYSHQDRAWGDWLHKALETYRLPRRLVGRPSPDGPIPRRLFPVFRDRDELPSSADLGQVVNQALRQSRYLIVICSPQSARSRWVEEEIRYFKSLGRVDRVLCVIVGGEPWASDRPESGLAECFAAGLRFVVGPDGALTDRRAEPVAADARGGKDGRAGARLKLIAGMLGLSFDDLRQRERQRLFWRRASAVVGGGVLAAAAGAAWWWQQGERQQALAAQAHSTRMAHLYENGRRELLAHNEARAAVFLSEVYSQGTDTPALRFMLARAMRAVDAEVLRVQTGSPVLMVGISPDGEHFLSVGKDFRLRIWDAGSGAKRYDQLLEEGGNHEYFAGFSPRGGMVVTNVRTKEPARNILGVFDLNGRFATRVDADPDATPGTVPFPVDAADQRITYVAPDKSIVVGSSESGTGLRIPGRYRVSSFCKDGRTLIAADESGRVLLLDDRSGALKRSFEGLHGTVVQVDSSQDCATVAAGTLDGSVRVWDARTGDVLMRGGQNSEIADLRLNASGDRLMTLADGVSVWDGHSGALIYSRKFLGGLYSQAMSSPDIQLLAQIEGDSLHITDPLSGQTLYSLDGHDGPAGSFDFATDGTHFVSGGSDGTVSVWRLPAPFLSQIRQDAATPEGPATQHSPSGVAVAFSHDGQWFFTGGSNGVGNVWDRATAVRRFEVDAHQGPYSAVAVAPDDASLATAGEDRAVTIWDSATGKSLHRLDGLSGPVRNLRFDPSGRMLAIDIKGGDIALLDLASQSVIGRFERDVDAAQAFGSGGQVFVSGAHGVVSCWDTEHRSQRWSRVLPDHAARSAVGLLAFSPDGHQILASTRAREAFILDAGDGHVLAQLTDDRSSVFWVARFSPDGQRIVFGDGNGSALIWEWPTGARQTLTGPVGAVTVATFSPDGALVLTAGKDGFEKIWDAKTGELLDSVITHRGAIPQDQAQFSPDGREVLSGGTDNVALRREVSLETRSPAEIRAVLACWSAWSVEGEALSPRPLSDDRCGPRAERR